MKEKPTASNKENKKPRSMTNFLLIWTFVVINLYITASLVILYTTGNESPTLTLSTYAFFGFECGAMSAIKISRIINENKKNGETDDGNDTDNVNDVDDKQ